MARRYLWGVAASWPRPSWDWSRLGQAASRSCQFESHATSEGRSGSSIIGSSSPWPDGRPCHPERFSRELDRGRARFGLAGIRLYDLRHTWATLALQAGVHPKVVAERLGHSSTSVTLSVYSHVTPAMQADAAEKEAGLISGPSVGQV